MVNSGLLIFREVAESWNSGNSTKSSEIIHKTRKMLKALPFNFAIGSFLECVVVERANDDLC